MLKSTGAQSSRQVSKVKTNVKTNFWLNLSIILTIVGLYKYHPAASSKTPVHTGFRAITFT